MAEKRHPADPMPEAADETDPDRGFLRDDGRARPDAEGDAPLERADPDDVHAADDPRHPNVPATHNADIGARPPEGAQTPAPSTRRLKDAYGADEHDVEDDNE